MHSNGVQAMTLSFAYSAGINYTSPMARVSVEDGAKIASQNVEQDRTLCGLISRLRNKNQAALAELYDITAARVYALARKITGEVQAAEEVVSDVYLQVWQQAERYDSTRGRVLAWVMTICRSRALDWLRRRDQAQAYADPLSLQAERIQDDATPLELLILLERKSRVHDVMVLLPETQQQLLSLAFFKGLTHQEIADHTGMPLGTVKTVIRTALLKLSEHLDLRALQVEGKL